MYSCLHMPLCMFLMLYPWLTDGHVFVHKTYAALYT